jgi:phenylalanyl-tRNA synthetase beta chain
MADLLKRMGLSARLINGDKDVVVKVPPTRSDILHACDIMEDVAIAYGYNNLTLTVPRTPTVARQQPLNKFTDLLRSEVAFAGYSEAFTFSLVTPPIPPRPCVVVSFMILSRLPHDTRSARPRRIL